MGTVSAGALAGATVGTGAAGLTAGAREGGELIAYGDTDVNWTRDAEDIIFGLLSGAAAGAAGKWLENKLVTRLFRSEGFRAAVFSAGMRISPDSALLTSGISYVGSYLRRNGNAIAISVLGAAVTTVADVARNMIHDNTPTEEEFWQQIKQKLAAVPFAEVVWRVIEASYRRGR